VSHIIRTSPARGDAGEPAFVVESHERILESYSDYLSDESRFGPAAADRLIVARSERQVAGALADAVVRGDEVTVSAGRTGIVGGAVPTSGTLLSVAEMKRVLGLRRLPDGRFAVRVEPGLSVAELREALASRDLGIDPQDLDAEARSDLEAFLALERPHFYPPDPTEDTAHLGATVAANASGARSFRYGATRAHVNALRLCLTTGEVLDLERGGCEAEGRRFAVESAGGAVSEFDVPSYTMPATKNAAGYYAHPGMDLVDLIVGSEGTLGVITEVELVLVEAPEGVLSALAFFDSDGEAIDMVADARAGREGVAPMSLEFFDSMSLDFLRTRKDEQGAGSEIPELPEGAGAAVLFEQDYTEETLMDVYEAWEAVLSGHGSSMENTWGGLEESELTKLRALRHSIAEEVNGVIARAKANHPEIHKIGTDAAVPHESLPAMFEFYRSELEPTGLSYVVFGHVGDSHLHLNIMPADPGELRLGKKLALGFAARAVEMGGTVSAEHGIGKLKHEFLRVQYGDAGLAEMAAVKLAFDPTAVLNRGVMFPSALLPDVRGSG
jgi:D-lactate dehydrogenase (cytochrome)